MTTKILFSHGTINPQKCRILPHQPTLPFVVLRSMEFEEFERVRASLCAQYEDVTEGMMMSSPAIHYQGKVFAFFSRKNKMVIKLGKNYDVSLLDIRLEEFSPFKTKKPLSGWYEADLIEKAKWMTMAQLALKLMKEGP